jgi:tRNA-specific 2-thiouridylase
MQNKKTVVVAMSGGVDSGCVAAMLHEDGYNVIGVTLQLYDSKYDVIRTKTCCGIKDIKDAKTTCAQIGIPHYVINCETEFKKDVIDDFVETYLAGGTPIPCVKCNQTVKFRDLFKVAQEIGADYVATGHYARIIDNNGVKEMHTAVDLSKDQTYFLYGMTQDHINKTLFPLGSMTKSQTREIARKLNLNIAEKSESQDICFIPNGDYAEFIEKQVPNSSNKEGQIVNIEDDSVIGNHNGAIKFTRGQRRGIGVAWSSPLYVIKTDIAENKVYVGEEKHLFGRNFCVSNLNIINKNDIGQNGEIECSFILRALQKSVKGVIKLSQDLKSGEVNLYEDARAITQGQACVLYDGTRVIGGGVINT